MNTPINVVDLLKCTTDKTDDIFSEFGSSVINPDDPFSRYIYVDNHCDVLGVCHLDTVFPMRNSVNFTVNSQMKYTAINTPALDDRLGYYTLAYYLPSMGIKLDWLMCDCEEQCLSTASQFTPNKQYNWVVEFDRMGSDCVLYQFENKRTRKLLNRYVPVSYGTYSDIAELTSLGVLCVNWGVGYHSQHSDACQAKFSEYTAQIERFRRFYADMNSTKIPVKPSGKYHKVWHVPSDRWDDKYFLGYNPSGSVTTTYNGDKWTKITPPMCDMCSRDMILIDGIYYCSVCDYGDINRCDICQNWYFIPDRANDSGLCANCANSDF